MKKWLEDNEWHYIYNHRKSNGDMGDGECDFCDVKSSVYIDLPLNAGLICKGCLLSAVDEINKRILKRPNITVDEFKNLSS